MAFVCVDPLNKNCAHRHIFIDKGLFKLAPYNMTELETKGQLNPSGCFCLKQLENHKLFK